LADENAGFAFIAVIGWPVPYLWHDFDQNGAWTTSWAVHWMIANVVIFIALVISIVYVTQAMRRFTLRTMLVMTAIVAALIVIGQALPGGVMNVYFYLLFVYFLPSVVALVLWSVRRWHYRNSVVSS